MRLGDLSAAVFAGATLMAPIAARAQAPEANPDLDRIRQLLDTPTPLRDTVETTPPTFRASVTEDRVDISRFWGEPDAVSATVRPSGGPWHHEFVNMVTPDEFKGYGGIFTNGEKAALATQAMGSALLFEYLPRAISGAITETRQRAARREVRSALEEFYQAHPGTRPSAPAPDPALAVGRQRP
jgi:hypothetical protein